MTYNDKIDILKENVQSLTDSIIWLQRSYTICNEFVDFDNSQTASLMQWKHFLPDLPGQQIY